MRSFKNFFAKGASRALMALAALMLTAPSAFAAGNQIPAGNGATAWTVYAFGNAQAVSDSFRAIHNFATSAMFQSLVGFIAIAGILVMGLTSGFNSATAKRLIGYCVGVFMVTYVFFGVTNNGPLTVSVEIIDTVDNTWKAPVTVPAVVGIPAAVVSTAGYEITRQIEASFPLPDAMKMSNGAPFNLAAAMLNDASKARITDSNLASSMAYYVQDCFVMGVSTGYLSPSVLLTSTDFLTDIKYPHPGVMVNTLLSTDSIGVDDVVSCRDAWNLIDGYIKAKGGDAATFLNNASAWARTPALSVVNASMDAVAQWATNNGVTNGGSMVKQAAVLSSFNGAYKQAAAATGNSDFLTGLALNQAYEAQTTGWVVGAEVFNRIMGYIFAAIQVFVYCITPFVLAAALIPGLGFALLKNFLQIILWLAIWQPMLAIVNFIVVSMQQAELGGAFASADGSGFTLASMGIISEKTANLRAASSFIGTMVPALAWAMVKGSVDFSRVIGSAVGENFAQQASNTMTTGNYSLNQASMDSFTANKHSIAHSSATGDGFNVSGQTMNRKLDPGGTNPATIAGQAVAPTVTTTEGTNEGGTKSNISNHTLAGANTDGYTKTHQTGVTALKGEGNTDVLASQGGTSTQGALTGNVQVGGPFNKPAGTGTQPGGGLTTPANQMFGPTANAPANVEGKSMLPPGSATAGANMNLAGNGSRTAGNQHMTNTQLQNTAAEMEAASAAKQASENAARARSAGDTSGWQAAQVLSISGPASLMERAAVSNQAMRLSNPFAGNDASAVIHQKVHAMSQPNAIQDSVEARKGEVREEKGDIDGRVTSLRQAATAGADKVEKQADGQIAEITPQAHDTTKATKSAAYRFGLAEMNAGKEAADTVVKGVKAAGDFVQDKATKAADTASRMFTQDKNAPAPTAAEVRDASTPAYGRPHAAAQPAAPEPGHAPVAVAAATTAPTQATPNKDGKQVPESQGQQANQPTQVAQLPVPPMTPQPLPTPEMPNVPQTQVAQAQQPAMLTGETQQLASLDPLNQPKPAATEGQLQSAQQRTEQLEQQRRNADNILLASSESTQVPELQEAIRNARDYTGRA